MKTLETILKIGATLLVMMPMMVGGLVVASTGIIADGPGGQVGLTGRLIAFAFACFSLLYVIPNRTIIRTKYGIISYLILTALPILYVLFGAVYLCFVADHDVHLSFALTFLLVIMALLGQAPFSLLIHMSRITSAESGTTPTPHSPSAQGVGGC